MRRIRLQPPDRLCSSRHLVYNSREFTLDLRLDFTTADEDLSLVGKLVQESGVPLAYVPAFLISGDQLMSRSLTGQLGEFRMRCRWAADLRLCLSLSDDELVEIDLDRRAHAAPRRPLLIDSLFTRGSDPEEASPVSA